MSLESLIALRREGQAPAAVWIVVGDVPAWLEDAPDTIVVRPHQDPRKIDWRAVVGLHVDVFELGDHPALFERVESCIDAARPKQSGLACKYGFSGVNEAHERMLRQAWERMAL